MLAALALAAILSTPDGQPPKALLLDFGPPKAKRLEPAKAKPKPEPPKHIEALKPEPTPPPKPKAAPKPTPPSAPAPKPKPPAPQWWSDTRHPGVEVFGSMGADGYVRPERWRYAGTTQEYTGWPPPPRPAMQYMVVPFGSGGS